MATRAKPKGMEAHTKSGSVVPPRLLTTEDVAGITGLSIETLAQWRSQKRGVPYIKIRHNCVRYRQSDLDGWLSERVVRVDADPNQIRRTV